MSLQHDHRKEERHLLMLNFQEVIPAIGLFLWLGWRGIQAEENAWAWFASSLIALGVAMFLMGSSLRQRKVEQSFDSTTRGEVARSLSQAQHRANLYRTVGWWYLTPGVVGILLMLVASGVDFSTPAVLGYLGIVAAGAVGLYKLNRKIGRDRYEPKVAHFSDLLAQLGER